MRFVTLLRAVGFVVSLVVALEVQAADLVSQGRQALDADRIDDAIALLEKAVSAEPGNPAALAWLGSAQVRKAGKIGGMESASRMPSSCTWCAAAPQGVCPPCSTRPTSR
jgi:hypothetical protein